VRYYELLPWLQEARSAFISSDDGERNLYYAILCTVELDVEETYGIVGEERLERIFKIWKMVREYDLAEAMGLYFVMLAGLVWKKNLDPDAEMLLARAVDRLRVQADLWELGWALIVQGNVWSEFSFDTDKLLEAEKIFVRLGPPFERGLVAHFLGEAAMRQRKPMAEIEKYVEQERELYHALGYSLFFPESNMVGYYLKHGETQRGFDIFHEEIRLHERRGNILQLADTLHYEALNANRYSTRDHAITARQKALKVFRKIGTKDTHSAVAFGTYELGEIYRVFGDKEKAVEHFERARIEFERLNLNEGLGYYHRSQGDLALKESRFEEALEFYKKYNAYNKQENHLWSIAQSHGKMALAHAHLGNINEARFEIKITLEKTRDWAEFDLELIALLAESICLIKEGKMEQAIEMAAFIADHPASWNETRWYAQEILDSAAQGLPEEVVHAAIDRGKMLNLETVVKNLIDQSAE
jgi:tetratricopeptide (TPR) repeat protein